MSRNRRPVRGKPAGSKRASASRRGSAAKRPTRRDLENALRQQEERFAAFANLSADWIWEIDENFRYTFMQTRDGMTFGRSADEFIGLNRLESLPVDWNSAAGREHADLLERRQPFKDVVLQTSKGDSVGWMSTNAAPIFDKKGAFKGYRGVTKNVTRQKRAEAALRLRERCLDGIGDAVIIGDASDSIIYVNPAFERITGFSAAEAIGRTSSFLLGPEPDLAATREVRAALAKGDVYRGRMLCYRKDGSAFWNDLTVSALRDDAGHMTHWVGVQADVTEQHQLEAQLRQAQKMEAIGALTGGIAHDFNNLLTIILGNSELLVEDLSDDEMRALAAMIQNAAARGAELTQRLLSFGRRQTLASQPLELNAVIENMAEMSRRTILEDITLRTEPHGGQPIAVADRSQLETALLNLIVNARDAMPNGGVLTLKTHEVMVRSGDFGGVLAPGSYPAVTVADSGVGMPAAIIERAFEPFFTTKEVGKGTGLGLAMVHGFAQQSSGHVVLKSTVGKGTAVTLILPRGELAAGVQVRRDKGGKMAEGRERILVVEDEHDVRRYVSSQLESFGYDVVEASTGAAALEMLGQDDTIALLFTDVVLPEGMSGAELADLARSLRPDLKVLFTSGYSEDVFSRNRQQLRDPLLRKPYNRRQLAEALRNVLDISVALSA